MSDPPPPAAAPSPASSRSLFTPSPAPDSPRHPLFDDHIPAAIPGSLHLAPDSTISQLIARTGAIPLIRQLAEDLAHRDRELVLFRRRAEERERVLRRMLVEAEVGNADIEKRLAAVRSAGVGEIEELVGEAMEGDVFAAVEEEPAPECPPADDARSVKSARSAKSAKAAAGWGSLFWGRREERGRRNAAAQAEGRLRSASDAGVEGVQRRRPSTAGAGEKLAKTVAAKSVSGKTRSRAPSAAGSAPAKAGFFDGIKDTAGRIVPLGGGEAAKGKAAEPEMEQGAAGPVEMDMIIPQDIQPPTLQQGWGQYAQDCLTDRFGFIYDKRRESAAVKGVAAMRAGRADADDTRSRPPTPRRTVDRIEAVTRWSHPLDKPAAAAAPPDAKPETPTTLLTRLSQPSPSTTSPTLHPPAFSRPPPPSLPAEETTVRVLLTQLSDLHDAIQHSRTQKWTRFLRASPDSPIGIATLGTEGRRGTHRWRTFRALVLAGIPLTHRSKIWSECSGAGTLRVPGYYAELLARPDNDAPHNHADTVAQIDMDIGRTLTDNIFFRRGPGRAMLRRVLVAYARRNPDVGYCQGMNCIAASLLLLCPTEEDAFYLLAALIERILPPTYFHPSLLASRVDQTVLKMYVRQILPGLHAHLEALGVQLEAITFQWFLGLFTGVLAAEALYRVWDVVFCVGGATFLVQVAVALLGLREAEIRRCAGQGEVYEVLSRPGDWGVEEVVRESVRLGNVVRRAEVEAWREREMRRMLRERGELVEEGEVGAEAAGRRAESVREESVREESPEAEGEGSVSDAATDMVEAAAMEPEDGSA